jgi:hypothetical protein
MNLIESVSVGLPRRKRSIWAIAGILALLAEAMLTATPASATTWRAEEHSCHQVGTTTWMGNIAVFCADLMSAPAGISMVFDLRLEAICENAITGAAVQCADVTVPEAGTFDTEPANSQWYYRHICGHDAGPCPANDRVYYMDETTGLIHYNSTGCQQYWSVIFTGAQIELPGGQGAWVTLAADLGSGHFSWC